MSLHIHISNRVEALAGTLADGIKNSGSFFRAADPLRKTRIVVQSRGVEIWLKQFFAGHGIPVVNFDFPFMQNAVKDILKINFGSSEVEKVFRTYSENAMMWSVERILRENKNSGFPEFNENEHIADVKRFQLASCIASEFDRLLTYRADILSAWENGGNSGVAPALKWLPELWRRLREMHSDCPDTTATLIERFLKLPETAAADPVSVFGIGSMPKDYFYLLRKHGEKNRVNFFYTDICCEYWKYHPLAWEKLSDEEKAISMQAGEYNPLIRANGHRNREFFCIVDSIASGENSSESECCEDWLENWIEYSGENLLAEIQNEILFMTSAEGRKELPWRQEDDSSLVIHGASSRMRQVEIAHDIILDEIEKNKISLNDILVMAPDIGEFSRDIHAVFSQGILADKYVVTDRNINDSNSVADCVVALIEAARGRFELSVIMQLLRRRIIRQQFDLSNEDVILAEKILRESGVRWGADAAMHEEFCGISFSEYSWQSGFDRILAGIALDDCELESAPVAMCDDLGRQTVISRIFTFFRLLEDLRRLLYSSKTCSEWCRIITDAIRDFAGKSTDNEERSLLIRSVAVIAMEADTAGCAAEIYPFEVFYAALQNHLAVPPPHTSFLSGKITFSSIMPMRNIPVKMIILLGMDDGKFPRRDPVRNIDVFGIRRPGERSRVFEDRAVFLETLLAAGNKLAVLFCCRPPSGRGEDLPPAAPVKELLDYVASTRKNGEKILVKHPANAFDKENFTGDDPRIFSYSEKDFALASLSPSGKADFIVPGAEVCSDEFAPEAFTVTEIENFLRAPQAYFLEKSSGMNVYMPEYELSDTEIFDLRTNYLKAAVLKRKIGNIVNGCGDFDAAELKKQFSNMALLPIGKAGLRTVEDIAGEAKIRNSRMADMWGRQVRSVADIILPGGDKITGVIEAVPDLSARLKVLFKKIREKDISSFYVNHLVLCVMAGENGNVKSLLRGETDNEVCELSDVTYDEAVEALENILEAMKRARSVCPVFFKKASVEWARKGRKIPATLRSGGGAFNKDLDDWPEKKCFPQWWDIDDADEAFTEESSNIFDVLARHLKEWNK